MKMKNRKSVLHSFPVFVSPTECAKARLRKAFPDEFFDKSTLLISSSPNTIPKSSFSLSYAWHFPRSGYYSLLSSTHLPFPENGPVESIQLERDEVLIVGRPLLVPCENRMAICHVGGGQDFGVVTLGRDVLRSNRPRTQRMWTGRGRGGRREANEDKREPFPSVSGTALQYGSYSTVSQPLPCHDCRGSRECVYRSRRGELPVIADPEAIA